MFRSLIAIVVALAVALVVIAKPAYAYSSDLSVIPVNPQVVITNQGSGNSVYASDSFNGSTDKGTTEAPFNAFINGLVKGAAETAGIAIGGMVVCYAIDGVATAFFPPAAAASAFCPAIGAGSGGANAVAKAL